MTKEDMKIKMANRLTNLIGRHISDGILPLSDKVVDAAIEIAEGYAKQIAIEFAERKERDLDKIKKAINGLRFSDEDIAGVYLVDKIGIKSPLIYFGQKEDSEISDESSIPGVIPKFMIDELFNTAKNVINVTQRIKNRRRAEKNKQP